MEPLAGDFFHASMIYHKLPQHCFLGMLFLQRIEEIALKHDQTLGVIVEMKLERRASRNFEIAQPKTKFWNFK